MANVKSHHAIIKKARVTFGDEIQLSTFGFYCGQVLEMCANEKDTAREIGAKLASLKGLVWVGLGLFVFGLVSMFYPPLKAIIGSVTTSIAILAGGVALMILPSLVVGNELLILGGVAVAVGGWFLAHRHGQLRGTVEAGKSGEADAGVEQTKT